MDTQLKKVAQAFADAGYETDLSKDWFGYKFQTRWYWFKIHSGKIDFDHCFSESNSKVSRDEKTMTAAYKRVHNISGVAFRQHRAVA